MNTCVAATIPTVNREKPAQGLLVLILAVFLAGHCTLLHERHGTIEEVARRTNLDRRTVKAYPTKHPRV